MSLLDKGMEQLDANDKDYAFEPEEINKLISENDNSETKMIAMLGRCENALENIAKTHGEKMRRKIALGKRALEKMRTSSDWKVKVCFVALSGLQSR